MGRNRHGGPEWATIKTKVLNGTKIADVARQYYKKFGKTEKQMACLIRVRKCKEHWQKGDKPTVSDVKSRLKSSVTGPKGNVVSISGDNPNVWVAVDSEQKQWIRKSWTDLKTVQKALILSRETKINPDGIPPEKMTKCFREVVESGLKLLAAERNLYVNESMELDAERSAKSRQIEETEVLHDQLKLRIDEHNKPKSNVS